MVLHGTFADGVTRSKAMEMVTVTIIYRARRGVPGAQEQACKKLIVSAKPGQTGTREEEVERGPGGGRTDITECMPGF